MSVLLDVQSELSLPDGGCGIAALVRRAAELGVRGLALADRGTLAAAPAFVRAARDAGLEPRVGVRVALAASPGIDLLIFPRRPAAWALLTGLACRSRLAPADLARVLGGGGGNGPDLVRMLAIVRVPRPTGEAPPSEEARASVAVRALRAQLGNSTPALALPDPRLAAALVELGRDLGLPSVLAPPVHIVETEDALLHRLLVLIRGDHEGGGGAPRPGRPAFRPGSLVAAAEVLGHELAPEAERFFADIAPADDVFTAAPVPGPAPDGERGRFPDDAEARSALRQHVLAACAADRIFPPESRLEAEFDALGRRRAIAPLARLAEALRALGDRPRLAVAPGWCESWVGWGLGLAATPPTGGGSPPAWLAGADPLPIVELEMGEGGARATRTLLEIAGAREPRLTRRLTAVAAVRWLATDRGYDGAAVRRLSALAAGRRAAHERLPHGARRLVGLAVRLAGRVVAMVPDANIRVFTPFSTQGRVLDRLREDATLCGGLAVRVTATPTLTLLERMAGGARIGGVVEPIEWEALADLFSGPLAGRGGAQFARLLRTRQPLTAADLARVLALAHRAPDAPAARVPQMAGAGARSPAPPSRLEIIFHMDAWRALRGAGIGERTARELLLRAAAGRGAPMAAVRPDLLRDLEATGERPERAEAILGALVRIVPHLEPEGPWTARARALASLADFAVHEPAVLASALVDVFPERRQAITAWAKEHRIVLLRPDLNASGVHSQVVDVGAGSLNGSGPVARAVRLGLLHLPGVDRVIAEVLLSARGEKPFAGRVDVVRRLRHKIPDHSLRVLVGAGADTARVAARDGRDARVSRGIGDQVAAALKGTRKAATDTPRVRRSVHALRRRARVRPGFDPTGDAMQYDLFSSPERRPRIYTAALGRYGILRIDRVAAIPAGSRVRTVGVIRTLSGLVTRGGRRLAQGRLEDGESGIDLLLLPALLETTEEIPLGRPLVVDGRVSARDGRTELIVESALPLALLAQVAQPALEMVLPRGFRRLRALKLRLLRSPGRSPVHVRASGSERAAAAACGLDRLRVTPDDGLIEELKTLVGFENVRLVGPAGEQAEPGVADDERAHAGAA